MKSFLTFAFALLAAPAWSLSCLRPDIVTTYERARDAEEGFWIMHGVISADQPIAKPTPDASGRYKDNASASTKVRVTGRGLQGDGFSRATQRDITLTITCFGHWCGSAQLDQEVFMAIEVKDTGPELTVSPCSSQLISFTEDGEDRLLRCVRDGVCEVEE